MLNCNIYFGDFDQLYVDGVINFENAAAAMQLGIKLITESKIININLSCLKFSDSSGLAVISAWVKYAYKHDKILKIHAIPKFLLDLAKVSNLEHILPVLNNHE